MKLLNAVPVAQTADGLQEVATGETRQECPRNALLASNVVDATWKMTNTKTP